MSVKIRLQRHGKKGKPFYWVVAADARSKRDGKFLEKIGTYNPNTNPATIDLNLESAVQWLHNGAQPTDTARAILSYKGALLKHHLDGGVRKGALTQEQADAKLAAWLDEKANKVDTKKAGLSKADEAAKAKALKAEKEANAKRIAAQAEAAKAEVEAPAVEVETPTEVVETAVEETPAVETVAEEAAPEVEAVAEVEAPEEVVETIVEETPEVEAITEEAAPEVEAVAEVEETVVEETVVEETPAAEESNEETEA
jgi:small subunit ribosomal protein S16